MGQQVILPPAPGVSSEGPRSRVLVPLPAVSWPWGPAWGSLEPPRRDGENAQKTGKNGEKMGEMRSKTCEQGKERRDQLVCSCIQQACAAGPATLLSCVLPVAAGPVDESERNASTPSTISVRASVCHSLTLERADQPSLTRSRRTLAPRKPGQRQRRTWNHSGP